MKTGLLTQIHQVQECKPIYMQANYKYFILSKWLYLSSDVYTTLRK